MTEIGRYRTADGGLAAYDKNGLTWRIQDQAPEITTPLPEMEWTGDEEAPENDISQHIDEEAPVDPFAGIEEGN